MQEAYRSWPDADGFALHDAPVEAILVARAGRPVLVVRNAAEKVRRLVVGFDGSPEAQRAVRFLARLEPERGNLVTVVTVTEPLWVPRATTRLPAATRASLRSEAIRFDRKRARRALDDGRVAASVLKRAGWKAKAEVRAGTPLEALLAACADLRADVVTVGVRGAGGLARALLGSVASGALNHSHIPVLIVP